MRIYRVIVAREETDLLLDRVVFAPSRNVAAVVVAMRLVAENHLAPEDFTKCEIRVRRA